MRRSKRNRWAIWVVAATLSMSLVACMASSLDAKVRKDGSVDFVAVGQVTGQEATAGISVDKYQGISIDPSGMESGALHVSVALPADDGTPETDADGTTVADDKDDATENSGNRDSAAQSSDGQQKSGNASDQGTAEPEGEDKTSQTSGRQSEEPAEPEPADGTTGGTGTTTQATEKQASDPKDGVAYEATFSPMDAEAGIVTVPSLDEGYYIVTVTADHATGTLRIRPYDLSEKEILDREGTRAARQTSDFFSRLFGISEEEIEKVEKALSEEEADGTTGA